MWLKLGGWVNLELWSYFWWALMVWFVWLDVVRSCSSKIVSMRTKYKLYGTFKYQSNFLNELLWNYLNYLKSFNLEMCISIGYSTLLPSIQSLISYRFMEFQNKNKTLFWLKDKRRNKKANKQTHKQHTRHYFVYNFVENSVTRPTFPPFL